MRRIRPANRPFRTLNEACNFGVDVTSVTRGGGSDVMSFTRPGVSCDIEAIKQMPEGDGRRAYCDCAFLELHTTTELTFANGTVFPQMPELSDEAYDAMLKTYIARAAPGYKLRVKIWSSRGRPDSNWHKCMSGWCASPDGCFNPQKAAAGATGDEAKDALNVHPEMAWPPWDQVGAAARSIPIRNADFWYTLGQLTTYDASAYDPIDVWKIHWTNPAVFILLGSKAALIPGNPQTLMFVGGTPALLPFVLEEISKKPGGLNDTNLVKYLLEPTRDGWIQFGKLILTFLPACGTGIISGCALAVMVQQVALDQITSGEINKVLDPFTRGIIVYLSRFGYRLIQMILGIAQMAANLKADPSLIQFLATSMGQIQNFPGVKFAPVEKDILKAATSLLEMAAVIAVDISKSKSPAETADDAVESLLKFRPSLLLKQGKAARDIILNDAAARGGVSLSALPTLITQLGPILDSITHTLQDINTKLNGAVNDVLVLFGSVKVALSTSTQVAADTLAATVSASTGMAVAPIGIIRGGPPVISGGAKTVIGGAGAARVALVSAGAAKTEDQSRSPAGGAASIALMAGAGFMAAGPVGALVGLGAGAFLSQKQSAALGDYAYGAPGITDMRTGLPRTSLPGSIGPRDLIEETASDVVGIARAAPDTTLRTALAAGLAAYLLLRRSSRPSIGSYTRPKKFRRKNRSRT